VEAKMQMEQTVAESRLEALYAHYKKNKDSAESELVAATPKMRLRMEMQKREQESDKDKRERTPTRPGSVRAYFTRLLTRGSGRGQRTSSSERQGRGERSDAGGASTSALSGSSSPGAPATDSERRLAQKILTDAAIKRAASLQLPPPAMCQVRTSFPQTLLQTPVEVSAVIPELKSHSLV
jgi:hypothetical protein